MVIPIDLGGEAGGWRSRFLRRSEPGRVTVLRDGRKVHESSGLVKSTEMRSWLEGR
jgi:hypothetical protein